ncbi:CPSF A subunit region-domain containing protein [Nitzschia inconspicua]|uniref:CPSF A subunit region-domain containing protein n=1 Tax=Nitzschia inconspicua TaxID=303405 RepID=A0A9K3PRE5_9STRA|nr:CPSF A subunit region-domain containing protein [Nitzschia inconspicua]
MAAPNTRPVHPCYLSIFEGKAGIEYSTWARITEPCCADTSTAPPDLVTAHGSTLSIYRVEESTGKMLLVHSYPNLAGNVCFLETLTVEEKQPDAWNPTRQVKRPDALLIGFSGHPRLAIVQVKPELLLATTLLDLTPALNEHEFGAITPLEQDLTASLMQRKGRNQATVSVVLGGGVAVVCLQLKYHSNVGGWSAMEEPYVLPLVSLAQSIENGGNTGGGTLGFGGHGGQMKDTANPLNQSIATGFGDILSVAFLLGYSEPTMVLLHANPHVGQTWSGRLGREEGGTRYSLVLTAVTVTVGHQRSALLWSVEVPADAMHVYSIMVDDDAESASLRSSSAACLVHCVNSVVFVTNTGQIQQCLATNGWVGSTLSATYSYLVESNPWPFPRLAVQLDGAHFSPINASTWFVVLRRGEVYLLQCNDGGEVGRGQWSFMSLYQTVGSVGEVSQIRCRSLGKVGADSIDGSLYVDKEALALSKTKLEEPVKQTSMMIGLLLVASRMGDSSLLGYALEEVNVSKAIRTEPGISNVKRENTIVPTKVESEIGRKPDAENFMDDLQVDDDFDRVLKLEEEALYAPVSDNHGLVTQQEPNVVPPSDDEQDVTAQTMFGEYRKRKRARMSQIKIVRSLNVLDSITSLGPLGPGCLGPLTESPEVEIDPTAAVANTSPSVGTAGYIFPCGYGSSGGLALLSLPGRDDRTVLAEADCLNAKALFSLPNHDIVFVAIPPEFGGTLAMRYSGNVGESINKNTSSDFHVEEIDLIWWCPDENARDFFSNCHLLAATDLTKDSFLILVASPINEALHSYFLVVFQVQGSGTIQMTAANQIDIAPGDFITTAALQRDQNQERVLMLCTITTGAAMFFDVNAEGGFESSFSFPSEVPMDLSEESEEEDHFYADRQIVAVDLFKAPKAFFNPLPELQESQPLSRFYEERTEENGDLILDDDDKELYSTMSVSVKGHQRKTSLETEAPTLEIENVWYAALCRQSGELEIYSVYNLAEPLWKCTGCGHGVAKLTTECDPSPRNPKGHKVSTREIRFFFCGPSSHDWDKSFAGPRPFCIVLETTAGDAMIYHANVHSKTLRLKTFERIPSNDVSRPSQESIKHFSKLRRKRIVSAKDGTESPNDFRYNRLFKFKNIQKQHGAFVAAARPFWLVSERGRPTILYHRSRHVAPAGARSRPVAGFCTDLPLPNGKDLGFMTLHERVGRVGSQRITFFDGIANINSKHSILPGGGLFVEKVPFGVTVRKIQFIDDAHVSTGTHPLYAILVSREYEADQSDLNDDGMTEEERQEIAEQKENAKIQRQVEADLGGFDVEQEWVEEIERENCFKIDKELGGAPPIPRRSYALWIVDAANGWQVVDSYELEEDEIGMTMQVMNLSEFRAEPGSSEEVSDEDLETKLFITLGTSVVGKDGEDIASKGRVVLFEVTRSKDKSSLQVAELNFVYDKKIHHGPVTALSCLVSEGTHRLIIGAGADVNIEQWGNGKLTQVGFFRATMHVLDIKLFKNFFILSDAYDSLYFLVWRESDKSLTLLAKDYDPIPVYATGILSRGGTVDFICHDDRQNLQFFQYSPGDPAARGGNKLVCRADFHLGCQTTDMPSHFCRSSLLINSATPSSTLAALKQQDTFHGKADDDQRLAVSFGTTDGGYSSVVPLSEPVFWRLTALQSVLVNALESDCALSHRAWRLYRRTPRRGGCQNNERKKGVIDGDLVMKYADLSLPDQEDLASAIGSTVDMILDNLLELRCSSMVL